MLLGIEQLYLNWELYIYMVLGELHYYKIEQKKKHETHIMQGDYTDCLSHWAMNFLITCVK